MFSMLNAIGGISNVADFTTPCVNITNSAFSQLLNAQIEPTLLFNTHLSAVMRREERVIIFTFDLLLVSAWIKWV